MFSRGGGAAWKTATSAAQTQSKRAVPRPVATLPQQIRWSSRSENGAIYVHRRNAHSSSEAARQKRESDREFLISVLESSLTKRDTKTYLETFGSLPTGAGPRRTPAFTTIVGGISNDVHMFVQGPVGVERFAADPLLHVAIVKLREPQAWGEELLDGVAQTLTRMRELGLLSVIVLECDVTALSAPEQASIIDEATNRVIRAIGQCGSPGAQVVDSTICKSDSTGEASSIAGSGGVSIWLEEALTSPLRQGHLLVVPPLGFSQERLQQVPVDANDVVLALTKHFSGIQTNSQGLAAEQTESDKAGPRKAQVDRIIVIDPLGGIPSKTEGNGARVFINLEQEFDTVQNALSLGAQNGNGNANTAASTAGNSQPMHIENLRLLRNALAVLPSTASALITSPVEAATFSLPKPGTEAPSPDRPFAGEVKTRRWQNQNPLIHNLLTDRPVYSASLPIARVKPASNGRNHLAFPRMPTTTLARRGLPVTIFPDPRKNPWRPPQPGAPRLRLTDTCIDLPRLIHLINDSFGRKLDAEHYLARVQDSLAGVIIAGEYEGGAILTWERPSDLAHADEETVYASGRMVPYLDKFAVLKKSQGAGGVADIVFNAMVRDCFPAGVCWRSRKNNPVNKWYFERSAGVLKLPDSNWAMFWRGSVSGWSEELMRDYEDVCRKVVPSWADGKQAD